MTILPPELDANYELLEEMHEGGMGAVYKARHRHFDEPCVIKVMHAKLNQVPGARDRFFREAKRGKQLHHPHIAEVQNFFVATDGKAYLVMEYVDGKNLLEVLWKRGALDSRLVATIGIQVLSALAYLHGRQLIHRDISPDNVMLTGEGTGTPSVKLIDLGISKSLEETSSLTGTGSFMGKLHYASPEQVGHEVDARSDLYSLGVVLYELATGAKPVIVTDIMAIVAAGLRDDPPRPFSETDPNGRVPAALRTVLLRALQKKPENRFQTADEFSEALQNALSADRTTVVDALPATEPMEIPSAPPPPSGFPPPSKPTALWPRVVIGTALFLLIVAFGARRMLEEPKAVSQPPIEAKAVPTSTELTVTAPEIVTPQRKQAAAEAVTRGKRLAGERRIREAYAAFAEATRADPGNAFAWANFGGAAALLGKTGEARHAYERGIAIEPSNWLAHYNLTCLLARSGARDEAFKHLEVATTQLRLQTKSRDERAAVMSSMRADEALEALRDDARFEKFLATD